MVTTLIAAEAERDGVVRPTATELTRAAHQRAIAATPADLATYVQTLLGQNLTALISGLEHPKTVGRWIRGQTPHPDHLTRLRNAFQIATLIESATSTQTAQSWFMGMNPYLDDRAPALVLADEPEAASRVMHAARAFLAHG